MQDLSIYISQVNAEIQSSLSVVFLSMVSVMRGYKKENALTCKMPSLPFSIS